MPGKVETTVNEKHNNPTYVGALPNMPMEALLSLGPPNNCGTNPSIRLFLAKYQAFPCSLYCAGDDTSALLHSTTIVDYIRDELKHDLNTDRLSRQYHQRTKQIYVDSRFCDLGNGIMIDISNSYFNSDVQNPNKLKPDHSDDYFLIASEVQIYYLPEHDTYVQELARRFSKMTVFSSKSCTLQMVCRNQHGYYLNGINIKKPLITDLALHYGKNFVSIHDKIIKNLNKKEGKGIVLLHGIPGSGKTHYIRYLIHEVEEKTLIYVPPDMAKEISSPEFLPFLMQYQDSILIIEDAENIIKDRNESTAPSQAVANLLNL
jgi:Cdc6-like AAA superfamily ATPase